MDSEFKNAVLNRIDCAKSDIEEAIKSQRETAYHLALGRLLALDDLAGRFDFMRSDELLELDKFVDSSSGRFYRVGKGD